MPISQLGQMITFSIQRDEDAKLRRYVWVNTKVGDTVRKIAANRGNPEDAEAIAKLNKIRSITTVLHHKPKRKKDKNRIRVPGHLAPTEVLHVLAGDEPPKVTGGYAKFENVDRPDRVGITDFTGYDPITLEIPVRFEGFRPGGMFDRTIVAPSGLGGRFGGFQLWTEQGEYEDRGLDVERGIEKLERMAGRKIGEVSSGPPPIIRVSVTDNSGRIVPLIPLMYQWSKQNPSAPTYRVAGIDWADGALRDREGHRIRQLATVTLQQHTRLQLATRSVTKRSKSKPKHPNKHKPKSHKNRKHQRSTQHGK